MMNLLIRCIQRTTTVLKDGDTCRIPLLHGRWKLLMAFTNEQIERYSRHIILKEVGAKGQKKAS